MIDEPLGSLFLITVEDNVPDSEQRAFREQGLYPAGHMGMGGRDTRQGSCTTFFNVFASCAVEARFHSDAVLRGTGRRTSSVVGAD